MPSLCAGIFIDGDKGTYGAFSMCSNSEIYSWTANQYWKRHGDKSCNINGTVELRNLPKNNDTECSFFLNQLDENGSGTIGLKSSASTTQPPGMATSSLNAGAGSTPGSSSLGGLSKGRLSIGAKAGIAVGTVAGAIVLLLLGLYILRLKKLARQAMAREPVIHTPNGSGGPGEAEWERKELDGTLILEVSGMREEPTAINKYPVELYVPTESRPHEVKGDPGLPKTELDGEERRKSILKK